MFALWERCVTATPISVCVIPNYQSVQHSSTLPNICPKRAAWPVRCEVHCSPASVGLIQKLADADTSLMHQTWGFTCVSNHRQLLVSVPLRNYVPEWPTPLETALWLPRKKHPRRVKEGFWAAAELIPALICTRINPKRCDRSRGAHGTLNQT